MSKKQTKCTALFVGGFQNLLIKAARCTLDVGMEFKDSEEKRKILQPLSQLSKDESDVE